jgi:flagellar basal-body rod protein FlgB
MREVTSMRCTHRTTLQVLAKALEAASLRQEAIAQNLANVDTPGYKAIDVSFEDQLKTALARADSLRMRVTHPKHLAKPSSAAAAQPVLVRKTGTVSRADGNNVDPEAEMAALAENQLTYSALTRLVSEKYNLLKYTISEGRR